MPEIDNWKVTRRTGEGTDDVMKLRLVKTRRRRLAANIYPDQEGPSTVYQYPGTIRKGSRETDNIIGTENSNNFEDMSADKG